MSQDSLISQFKCITLQPSSPADLGTLFNAKMQAYEEGNPDVTRDRDEIFGVMREGGPEFWREHLDDPVKTFFAVVDDANSVVGSAQMSVINQGKGAYFSNHHIGMQYRGQGLIDLLYQAAEDRARALQGCETIELVVPPHNQASQKAALRNGYDLKYEIPNGYLLFEKTL